MMIQGFYTLKFLENIAPGAAQSAKKMEELLYEDPGSSIVKARLFAEEILNEVFKQEDIDAPYLSTLYDKISYLTREGYIKREVQQALDNIRLTGNKAAHNSEFNDITEAFKLHKEMYKLGVWFSEVYSLDQIKIPIYEVPKPRQKEDIKELVNRQILELLGTSGLQSILQDKKESTEPHFSEVEQEADHEQIEIPRVEVPTKIDEQEENKDSSAAAEMTKASEKNNGILNKDLGVGESYLVRELRRLMDSSQEAIENANQFSSFKNYMHVDRKIQLDLENILKNNKDRSKGNLILLCGSVGDGKSHLLAYLNENKPDLLKQYRIYNDATESFSPNKNAMETLEEVLNGFSDQNIKDSEEKVILAINMGVLHNFINTKHKEYSYETLKQFVEQSDLFSPNITTFYSDENFDLLSFGDYHSFELTDKGVKSSFYSSLVKKVFAESDENPFYLAYQEDKKEKINTMVHENYKLLQNNTVQYHVVQLIIQTMVKKKLVISARAFLNFIADILIPDEIQNTHLMPQFDVLESSLPNLLFNRKERSTILNAMSQLDPIHRRSITIDQLVIQLNTLNDWDNIIDENIEGETAKEWLIPFISKSNLQEHSFNLFFESFIRITFLTNDKFFGKISDPSYLEYLKSLYYFNTGNRDGIIEFYEEIKKAIFKWKGSPKKDYIYFNKPTEKFRLAQKLNLKPTIKHLKPSTESVLESFKSTILLAYTGKGPEDLIFLEIDFPLFSLLSKVKEGYRPNKKDEEDAIKFVEFIEKIMSYGEKKSELLVHFPSDDRFYVIKRGDFDAFVFERE
jgi:DNA phosphorothioation-dependent restriction protein DptF